MTEALKEIIPKLGLSLDDVTLVSHQGVSDLEASLPHKLRAWRDPTARFLILRDNDGGDCSQRKQRLVAMAQQAGRGPQTLVRVVCQELEAWFLGDAPALAAAGYPTGPIVRGVRDPDAVAYPSEVLRRLVPQRTKITGARQIAGHMNIESNRSASFRNTISAIRRLTQG